MHSSSDATLNEDSLITDKNRTQRQMPNKSWNNQAYDAFCTQSHQTATLTPQMPLTKSKRATSPILGRSTVYLDERHFFSRGRHTTAADVDAADTAYINTTIMCRSKKNKITNAIDAMAMKPTACNGVKSKEGSSSSSVSSTDGVVCVGSRRFFRTSSQDLWDA